MKAYPNCPACDDLIRKTHYTKDPIKTKNPYYRVTDVDDYYAFFDCLLYEHLRDSAIITSQKMEDDLQAAVYQHLNKFVDQIRGW